MEDTFECAKCKKTKPLTIKFNPPKIKHTGDGQPTSVYSEDNYTKRKHISSSGVKKQLYYCKECVGTDTSRKLAQGKPRIGKLEIIPGIFGGLLFIIALIFFL